MTTLARKALLGAVAALSVGATMAVSVTEASAQYRRHGGYHHHYRGGGWGGPVAAGVIGGLALCALAAPRYGYAAPAYGYAAPATCYLQDQPTYDTWGRFAGYQRVRVCD